MVSELESRLKGNLLSPLTFSEGEIDKFIRDNRCGLCGGHLLSKHTDNRQWIAYCYKHGDIREHNYVTTYKADKVKQSVIDGRHELKPESKLRDEQTILEELGF